MTPCPGPLRKWAQKWLPRLVTLAAGAGAFTVWAQSGVNPHLAPVWIGFDDAYSLKTNTSAMAIEWGIKAAMEEINAAGGVNGRMLETRVVDIDLLTPEGTVAAFQSLVEGGVQALAHSFAIIPQPAMDVAAVTGTPCSSLIASQRVSRGEGAAPASHSRSWCSCRWAMWRSAFIAL